MDNRSPFDYNHYNLKLRVRIVIVDSPAARGRRAAGEVVPWQSILTNRLKI